MMNLYVDIDNTICITNNLVENKYEHSVPIKERITDINRLYDEGKHITYWTARGSASGVDYTELTVKQLAEWGCKYHSLRMNKPSYDLYIDDKCCNSNEYWNNVLHNTKDTVSGQQKTRSTIVKKGWGYEVIFVNNPQYCGKVLHFNKGAKFSMHYHLRKKETWYVANGLFTFKYINTKDATVIIQSLEQGDVITNEIGEPHQLICEEEGDIFEVSTTHDDTDSYRIARVIHRSN